MLRRQEQKLHLLFFGNPHIGTSNMPNPPVPQSQLPPSGKHVEKTKQGYLAKYPWILFRGSFVAGSSHLTNLPTTAPFPTRRSTLRCPTECAASACGARCIGRRTAMPFPPICFSAKKPPSRTLMPTVFPNTCLHAELLRRTPLKCADSTKRDRRRGAESDFPRKFAEKLSLMLARSE